MHYYQRNMTLDCILHGDDSLSWADNELIIKSVYNFITDSKRFN